ncbi:PTS transporter subunit EIIC [Xylocopilactobacillus apicola]|uniref:PTS beta-glucoside transporter subunit IIABC n=1 Tax=Xylocopilactobacillus apicola TaxID=2932184 RepID=A0AAU9DDJ7_9LACO|nr:PTS transporter subunit EIIC [Xylocopilactobacillus apicola]BDR59665.1 hypothetical protein XA3_21060 [Xylocopilactobacillus apicola]
MAIRKRKEIIEDYRKLAANIIEGVGGADNVKKVIHCITRLRFYLVDESIANTQSIADLPGVAGAVYNSALGQYQVIIGPAVNDVYEEVITQLGDKVEDAQTSTATQTATSAPKGLWGQINHSFQTLIGTITGSMIPVIGLLAASGILKGVLTLITELQWVKSDSATYVIINAMGDAVFYFLPILVGFTAAKQLKSDPITVAAIGGLLVHPSITAIYTGTTKFVTTNILGVQFNADFFGLPVRIPQYTYSIFPIIVAAWLARPIGNWLKKILPLSLRSIFQPLFTIFIVGTLILVVFGPIVTLISQGFATLLNWLLTLNEAVAGLIIGGFYQGLVIFGLHWMVVPLVANDIANTGHSVLNALISYTMIAQAAGSFAVALKTKNRNLRSLAVAGGLSGFAGVTEPAMYGVNLKYGKVFWLSNIGSAVGATIGGFFHIDMFGFTGSWIGLPSYFQGGTSNTWIFIATAAVTTIVSFVCVYFWGFNDRDLEKAKIAEQKNVFKDAVA